MTKAKRKNKIAKTTAREEKDQSAKKQNENVVDPTTQHVPVTYSSQLQKDVSTHAAQLLASSEHQPEDVYHDTETELTSEDYWPDHESDVKTEGAGAKTTSFFSYASATKQKMEVPKTQRNENPFDKLCRLESAFSRDLTGHISFHRMPPAIKQNIKHVRNELEKTIKAFEEGSICPEKCDRQAEKFEWFVDTKLEEIAWIEQHILNATSHLPNVQHQYQGKRQSQGQNEGDLLVLLGEVVTELPPETVDHDTYLIGLDDDDLCWVHDEQLKCELVSSIKQICKFAEFNPDSCVRLVDTVSVKTSTARPGKLFIVTTDGRVRPFALPDPVQNLQIDKCGRSMVTIKWDLPLTGTKNLTGLVAMRRFAAVDGHTHSWHVVDTGRCDCTSYSFVGLEPAMSYEVAVSCLCAAGYCVPVVQSVKTRPPPGPGERLLPSCRLHCKGVDGYDWFTLPVRESFVDKSKMHMLRKLEVGESSSEIREHKVLLVVGASGSGKSTLIAALINYMYDVKQYDRHRLLVMVEDSGRSQSHSQTKFITAYQLHWVHGMRVPFTLTIVDTPGFGDTDGLGRDQEITKQLKAAFESAELGLTYLNGVAFVAPAGTNRLTPAQKYVFDSILSVFGKDVAPNIFVMATFADNRQPQLEVALQEHGFPHQHTFMFNNSSFIIDKPSLQARSSTMFGNQQKSLAQMYWQMGQQSFKGFFQTFGYMNMISLQLTREVLDERQRLELKIQALQTDVNRGVSEMQMARDEYNTIEQLSAKTIANKGYTFLKTVMSMRRVVTDNHTTTCMDCDKTCHENCAYENDEDKSRCCAMDRNGEDSCCRICPKHCKWQRHVNRKYIIEDYEETKQETIAEMKNKYDEGIQGISEKENILRGILKGYQLIKQQVVINVHEARNCLARLDDIGLRAHPLSLVECIDQMIESVKNEQPRKRNWQRRLNELTNARETAQIMEDMRQQGIQYDPLAALNKQFDDLLDNRTGEEPEEIVPEPDECVPDVESAVSTGGDYSIKSIMNRMKKIVFGDYN